MNRDEKALARGLFRLKVHESDGQAFEGLFVAIMQKANPDFIPIKPQGNIGDRKNDGYDRKNGRYYQVFAPEDIRKSRGDAVEKLKEDFIGLKAFWDKTYQIKEYYFVCNDKYKGSFPTIEDTLAAIKREHKLDDCGCFLVKHLEDVLFTLPNDVIISIVGFIPDPAKIEILDYSILNEVIKHILQHKRQLDLSQILKAPDFDDKIKFNGLGPQVSTLLNNGSYHVGVLENYFDFNSSFTKQELRDTLNEMYRNALTKDWIENSVEVSRSDLVFFDILRSATPNDAEATQNAALVVMAYFFESCDIFEDPDQDEKQ